MYKKLNTILVTAYKGGVALTQRGHLKIEIRTQYEEDYPLK
jgi:hypothetical protein